MNRRRFLQYGMAASGITAALGACKFKRHIKGSILGASSTIGHLLRNVSFTSPVSSEHKKVVIIGAGISALSAANYLYEQGIDDMVLLELEDHAGGNASFGTNAISAFPLGAHYIPVPNNDLVEYLSFLQSANVITSFEDGLPVYNESFLCFDPEERLYINGKWQEGLIPQYGVPADEKNQIERFLEQMQEFRTAKGKDGKDAFAIPVNRSSKDEVYVQLDGVTMKEWMHQNGYTSSYLHWYVNYCTRDDFGTPHDRCSAWAGIHYFAGRKGKAVNAAYSDVLTWPQGNGYLVQQLCKHIQPFLRTGALATKISVTDLLVKVEYLDVKEMVVKEIVAAQCIIAVPQFIAARLLNDKQRIQNVKQQFEYAPWMVANIVTGLLEERSGEPLSWDNVIYGSESLGYVDATHQLLQQHIPQKNITYYLPLTAALPAEERRKAPNFTHEQWVNLILADLQKIHPNLREAVQEINIQLWGHAMVQPLPGIIHGSVRNQLSSSLYNRVHFAHTDLAGISIFEEGFYQGIDAAKKILAYEV
jgi:monoamine oxidase